MRELTNKDKIVEFMRLFGRAARTECRVYFTGGVTAVLMGWRDSTIDIDLKFEPESDELFRSLPDIKEKLDINIELSAPSDFIPAIPGWQDRSPYIGKEGKASFFHYDPYSQALAKIERGHEQDVRDIESMVSDGSVERGRLLALFRQIEPLIYRYPAVDKNDFEKAVRKFVESEIVE